MDKQKNVNTLIFRHVCVIPYGGDEEHVVKQNVAYDTLKK